MGSGLVGGPLTGSPPTGSNIAPAGQSAILAGPLGATAGDVVTKAGSTLADASVSATAELFRVATGIGGTELGRFAILKGSQATGFDMVGVGTSGQLRVNNSVGLQLSWSTVILGIDGTNITTQGAIGNIQRWTGATGLISVRGTDSSGTPGAATIDKPSGKSAIALGAASVVITNALVTAASCVHITPETRDATCKELIAVPGAGSFTVSGSAVAAATLVFSWHVQNIL